MDDLELAALQAAARSMWASAAVQTGSDPQAVLDEMDGHEHEFEVEFHDEDTLMIDLQYEGLRALPFVLLAQLPPEAAETVELIDAGGPFPEDEDGGTFGNREDLLPDEQMGYYAEYTVPTPGSQDRGARRIVAGDEGELYWTEDHYDSFRQIMEGQ